MLIVRSYQNYKPWQQRIGYGVADLGCNLVWQMLTTYLMFFYTDVVGLMAAQVSVLFLITRLIDAGADLLMGLVIDKTNTKWGKSRPYFLWGAIPFGLLSAFTFYVPHVNQTDKLYFAYISYAALSLAYTIVNMPLTSILPSLTEDVHERTILATSRILFSFIGATIVGAATIALIKFFGGGSQETGFFKTMALYGAIATFLFLVTFATVKEKVIPNRRRPTIRESFSTLKGNHAWYLFALNIIFMWGAFFLQQGSLLYFYTYYIRRPDLVSTIGGISALVPILGSLMTPYLSKRFLKRDLFLASSGLHLVGILLIIVVGLSIKGLIIGTVISALGFGLRHAIYFSMQADPVDYGEWKTGINSAGLIAAINQFVGKMAMAGGGALAGLVLTIGGYRPNQLQTTTALFAIQSNFLYIPAVLILISIGIMSFYKLDKIYPKIRTEIDRKNIIE